MGIMKKIFEKFRLSLMFAAFAFLVMMVTFSVIFGGIILLTKLGIIEMQPHAGAPLMLFALLSLAVGTAFAFFLSTRPLKSINEFIKAVDKIADGDYSTRVEVSGSEELQGLCRSFNNMAQELESVELLKSDFINNFAHEFKTPIVSIRGFAKMLRKSGISEDERNEYLDIIISESERLSSLSSNVLTLTKLEGQAIISDKSSVNISEQIRLAIAMLDGKWSSRHIDVSMSLEDIYCTGNAEMLKQIWINLLDNAVKFSPDYGNIEVSCSVNENRACVDISDQGCGISPQALPHIFDKFYQADSSHSGSGNGLGLAIAKKIALLHGGDIAVVRSNEYGTVFRVTLPV